MGARGTHSTRSATAMLQVSRETVYEVALRRYFPHQALERCYGSGFNGDTPVMRDCVLGAPACQFTVRRLDTSGLRFYAGGCDHIVMYQPLTGRTKQEGWTDGRA